MGYFFAILFMAVLTYQLYAVPLGVVFVFFLTRRLARSHPSKSAVGISLASAMAIFTPLKTPAASIFPDIYAPWYLSPLISPPMPQLSWEAVLITLIVALISSLFALIIAMK